MILDYINTINALEKRLAELSANYDYRARNRDVTILKRIETIEDELLDLYLAVHLMSR